MFFCFCVKNFSSRVVRAHFWIGSRGPSVPGAHTGTTAYSRKTSFFLFLREKFSITRCARTLLHRVEVSFCTRWPSWYNCLFKEDKFFLFLRENFFITRCARTLLDLVVGPFCTRLPSWYNCHANPNCVETNI